ncbi:MAG: hypothetical protein H0T10_02795 [Actinobacteria bacterium]|nr:hypothetical protein [Actinomycetota bacterium]
MNAYKFLAIGGNGRFSEFPWPRPVGMEPGTWVAAAEPLEDCRHGVHACTLGQLLDWMDDELWEIELDGKIVAGETMVVAERGRLLRQVVGWDGRTAQEFADACAWRARDYALSSLRRVGLTDEAERLVDAVELGELRAGAVAAFERSDGAAAELTGFAADAVSLAQGLRPEMWDAERPATLREPVQTPGAIAANLAFVVAHAAGREAVAAGGSETAYDAGFAAEREWQLGWLSERLGIRTDA